MLLVREPPLSFGQELVLTWEGLIQRIQLLVLRLFWTVRAIPCCVTMRGMVEIETISMVVKAVRKSVKSSPMVLGCTMYMGTYGSGQPTGWDVHFHRPVPTRTVIRPVPTASFVVAAGTATRATCGRRFATTAMRRVAPTPSGFVYFYPNNQRLLGCNPCGGFVVRNPTDSQHAGFHIPPRPRPPTGEHSPTVENRHSPTVGCIFVLSAGKRVKQHRYSPYGRSKIMQISYVPGALNILNVQKGWQGIPVQESCITN